MATTTYRICTLPGDGIGPEIMGQAKRVLAAIGSAAGVEFVCEDQPIGGAAIDATREAGGEVTALPESTLEAARASDAVLLAAVGGPKWDTTDPAQPRPEQGLLGIRKGLGLYLNLRPVRIFDALRDASTLKPELLEGVDIMIVRELTGGLYFGQRVVDDAHPGAAADGGAGRYRMDGLEYSEYEIERVIRRAFEIASGRPRKRLCSVDKANVLGTSKLWRAIAHELAAEYPDVELCDMYVDNCAMQLVADPAQFDVIVTENTFGDIISDEASELSGSLGMLASASMGEGTSLYEPAHGSAPDIAGQGIANPLAQLLSVALMLRYSCDMAPQADALEAAIEGVLDDGWRTRDIADEETPADHVLGTAAMTDKVLERLG
jgi:3-isopropylmalate dehydrogenase